VETTQTVKGQLNQNIDVSVKKLNKKTALLEKVVLNLKL